MSGDNGVEEGGRISFKLPFDPPSVVIEGDKMTATAEDMFVDYWEDALNTPGPRAQRPSDEHLKRLCSRAMRRRLGKLSRNSWHGQRIGDALAVEIDDGVMDG